MDWHRYFDLVCQPDCDLGCLPYFEKDYLSFYCEEENQESFFHSYYLRSRVPHVLYLLQRFPNINHIIRGQNINFLRMRYS